VESHVGGTNHCSRDASLVIGASTPVMGLSVHILRRSFRHHVWHACWGFFFCRIWVLPGLTILGTWKGFSVKSAMYFHRLSSGVSLHLCIRRTRVDQLLYQTNVDICRLTVCLIRLDNRWFSVILCFTVRVFCFDNHGEHISRA
jgi:hypothetical protein